MSGAEVLFAALAVLTGASALLAVTSARVVHCALWLVVSLGSLAGVYLVLGAEVVALVQLLVYVGAVVVLVLFALMLTRAPISPHRDLDAPPARRAAAAVAGLSLAGLVGGTLMVAVGGRSVTVDAGRGSARSVGTAVFGGWVLPFELLSVLLLAALVAAMAVSRDRQGRDGQHVEDGEPRRDEPHEHGEHVALDAQPQRAQPQPAQPTAERAPADGGVTR